LAAETGTGQSMYEIEKYFSVNVQGTATLLQAILDLGKNTNIKKIIVASSRAIYGEGSYQCETHGLVYPSARTRENLDKQKYEPLCEQCSLQLVSIPTHETCMKSPTSFYGLTKQIQEESTLLFAKTHLISGIGLRFQNVYGPGQSLNNPYTGVLGVFANKARMGEDLDVYEDGLESRDFVYISDVVQATYNAMILDKPIWGAFNVGSGSSKSIADVAQIIADYYSKGSKVNITHNYRIGDIRHNNAELSRVSRSLNYRCETEFNKGIKQYLSWVDRQSIRDNEGYKQSIKELKARGIFR
jgi:dTDP-L-rhamnose 4-epimerase